MAGCTVFVQILAAMASLSSAAAAVISDPLAADVSEGVSVGPGKNGSAGIGAGAGAGTGTGTGTGITRQPRRLRRDTSNANGQLGLARNILQTENAKAGSAAQTEGRKKTLDLLSDLVYSGAAADLDEDEKTLGRNSDPTLAELNSVQGEISEYYWRQLRYGAQSHSYLYEEISKDDEPAPVPAPKHPDLPSEVECTSNPYCGGKKKTVVVEFQYNVECSGYVSGYEFDKLDYAILEEAASGQCDNGDYEWLQRRDLSAKKENIKVEAGPNSVLDILGDEVEDELQDGNGGNKNNRRKLEIVSIDAKPDDVLSGNGHCTPQNDIAKDANCCQQRTGYVTVTYNECNDNSSEEEVVANILCKIEEVMGNSNENIFDNDKGNVVELVYVGPETPCSSRSSVVASSQEMVLAATEKVSAGAWAAVILALLALLALLAMLVSRHRRRTDAKDRTIATDKLDGETYVAADYGNLGGRHSKLDVHQCKSSLCKECTNGNDRHMMCHHIGSHDCLPVVDEESPEIVKQLAAIRDRDVVFLRTQGIARGQTTEHVSIDLGSSSSSSTAISSPPSTPPRSPSRSKSEGPTFVDQEEITASLDINGIGSSARSRVI